MWYSMKASASATATSMAACSAMGTPPTPRRRLASRSPEFSSVPYIAPPLRRRERLRLNTHKMCKNSRAFIWRSVATRRVRKSRLKCSSMPTAQQLSRVTSARATRDSEGTHVPPFLAKPPRSSRKAPRATGRLLPPPGRARFAGRAKKQRPVSFSPLLAPATRSREAAMVAASPAEGAMTVRKGMISRLECENFKCVPDTSRVAPIRAVPPRCAFAFPRLERAPDPPRGRERENAVRRARRFRASAFADRIPRLLPRFLNAGRTRATR